LSATIGGRAGVALVHPEVPRGYAAKAVADEILEHLPSITRKRGLDLALMMASLASMPVSWANEDLYGEAEAEARKRLAAPDLDDWPSAALALVMGKTRSVAVWTQDRDFEVSGLSTITTGELLDFLEGRS
jgi:predicted nucleic acid-binding protein